MSQLSARPVARCEDCSKTFRVPSPDRAYSCKACGGIVRVIEVKGSAEAHETEGLVLCNDCQTLNPRASETCAECDADLADATVVEDEEEAADLLEETKGVFRRASRWGSAIAWTYHGGALAYAVATLFAVLALARPDVPVEEGVVVVVLTVFLSVLMGTAALHLLIRPFLWTLSVAVLATVVAVLHAVGPNPLGLALYGSAAWAVLSWGLLYPAKRFQDAIDHHKDLYIEHHASLETRRSLKGRAPGQRHERLLRAMRRADRRAWKISAAVAIALVLTSAIGSRRMLTDVRPVPFDGARVEFEAAWNDGTPGRIVPLFDPRVREVEGVVFGGLASGHGWDAGLPALPEGTLRVREGERLVDYDLAGDVDLTARFVLQDRAWRLAKLELPYPPVAPTLERFRAAWDAGDPEGLAGFFSEGAGASLLAKLAESKAKRGWEVLPPIQSVELAESGGNRAVANLALSKRSKVTTSWAYQDDGTWGLYGLKMPVLWIKPGDDGDE